tara:strand:- start:779 stop:1018 length:240 start_codon:yes stop_codon:yes gene_type:complete
MADKPPLDPSPKVPNGELSRYVLMSLGRLEGRVDMLLSSTLPHLHSDVMANRRLTMWVGSILLTVMCTAVGLLVRVLLG